MEIGFKVAKLAQEKGVIIPNDFKIRLGWYNRTGKHNSYTPKEPYYTCSQSWLQKWLRDNHNIHISFVTFYNNELNKRKYSPFLLLNNHQDHLNYLWTFSYEEALEKGLLEALKLIK